MKKYFSEDYGAIISNSIVYDEVLEVLNNNIK